MSETIVESKGEQLPYVKNPRGHVWIRNKDDGVINIFGFEEGFCNGPRCAKCGYGFCHHCHSGPTKDCPGEGSDKPN